MHQQVKQNIKGVTLLEIVVVLAIIGVISSVGFLQFSKTTSAKRSLAIAEGIKSVFVNASTQIKFLSKVLISRVLEKKLQQVSWNVQILSLELNPLKLQNMNLVMIKIEQKFQRRLLLV